MSYMKNNLVSFPLKRSSTCTCFQLKGNTITWGRGWSLQGSDTWLVVSGVSTLDTSLLPLLCLPQHPTCPKHAIKGQIPFQRLLWCQGCKDVKFFFDILEMQCIYWRNKKQSLSWFRFSCFSLPRCERCKDVRLSWTFVACNSASDETRDFLSCFRMWCFLFRVRMEGFSWTFLTCNVREWRKAMCVALGPRSRL